ncbi:peptidoglycan DD-metalloendopeptidase family protein [Vogesella sp. DC21W]|uniref:Peptidoglycan DD-metalloendopeptidase family protein n=1 Tax=Vogesella aquatica TaxID=2984206 RepID=A0ABT5J4A5_9NEIS|nr:peptidoglycan DD-metalloendopeptidase family protein [Vogesella aquatica]MDC7718879.1 peptidoglycan DD-metalloendopeptidase family protein [Vogesella aquatica]
MKKLLCLTLLAGAVHAAPASKPLDPAAPQQDLQSVRKAITTLQQDIAQKEAARQQTASAIAQSEEALEATHEALNALEQKQGSSSNQLEQYQAELLGIRMKVAETRQRVGKLLASTYKRGQHDAMNLMLNQGDPNQASRDLTYYTHISRAQQELIAKLRDQEIQLQAITERLEDELVRLGRMSAEKVQQKRRIEAAKNQRQVQVSQLDASIRAQQTRLQQLKEDEKQLTVLIARINAEIERRRQEAIKKAAAAKKAREEAARLAAEKRRQQVAEAKKQGKKPPPEPKAPPVERVDEVVDGSASGRAFKSLQGRMKLPVSGEIAGRFGAARGEGNSWKGLYIRTAPGTPVRVVADGTVVYADWLRGFGNAMIIDHGGNYLTVYTGFSAMARGNGAGVKAGDVLGTSGTMESGETGLYFELRYLGRPINPQSWAR